MSILIWDEQFLVGIDSVDTQHRRLVELINRLDEFVALGQDRETILKTVDELVLYTLYHFRHEEELMLRAGYNPDFLAAHRLQHQDFVAKMQKVQNDMHDNVAVISKDLLDFLVNWLCRHTLNTDKLMAISLNEGKDPSQIEIDRRQLNDVLNSHLYSALRESEDRFKELADNLQSLIWVTNAKYVPVFCNRYWFQVFGLTPDTVNKQRWMAVIHPEDRKNVVSAYEKTAGEHVKFQIQYRLRKEPDQIVWILETAVPRIRKNGEFAGLMGCGMDITSQKQAEQALLKLNQDLEQRVGVRTQELMAANRTLEIEKDLQTQLNRQLKEAQAHLVQSEKMVSIGQLAAGVAHEINNPLGYIYSNLNSLKGYIRDLVAVAECAEKLAAQLPAGHPGQSAFNNLRQSVELDYLKTDAADLVAESLEGATRAKKIVQDLRDFSRVDKQEREMFDLEAGINATLNIVNNEIKYKAEVVREFGGLKPFECVGAQLNQVFMNLLVNAAQAIEEFGKITVRTGYKNADWLWVEIEDTGKGIADDAKAKIFDPFFTTKPVGKGTGLGLSLSYKIIKDHQGHIEVQSSLGKGSKFRIELPVRPLPDESAAS